MRKLREKIYDDAAFTLIELLVVIAVLGILAGIAVPRITGVQDKAKKVALLANAKTIQNSYEMYYASENAYPTSGSSLSAQLSGSGIQIDIDTDYTFNNSGDTDGYDISLQGTEFKIENITPGGISEPIKVSG